MEKNKSKPLSNGMNTNSYPLAYVLNYFDNLKRCRGKEKKNDYYPTTNIYFRLGMKLKVSNYLGCNREKPKCKLT